MRRPTHRFPLAAFAAATLVTTALLPATAAGAATPTCFGKPATHVMQPGEGRYVTHAGQVDVVVGSSGDDVVVNSGSDRLTDVGDYLCGGPGNDDIRGDAGPDHINGGDGDDHLFGWRGADVVQGNAGDDTVSDASMSDQDHLADVLRGGTGNDVVIAGWGKDKAYGEAGNDQLVDDECDGPTVLDGGPGSDHLESSTSSYLGYPCSSVADQVTGGDGTDTATVDRLDTVTAVEQVSRV